MTSKNPFVRDYLYDSINKENHDDDDDVEEDDDDDDDDDYEEREEEKNEEDDEKYGDYEDKAYEGDVNDDNGTDSEHIVKGGKGKLGVKVKIFWDGKMGKWINGQMDRQAHDIGHDIELIYEWL